MEPGSRSELDELNPPLEHREAEPSFGAQGGRTLLWSTGRPHPPLEGREAEPSFGGQGGKTIKATEQ